MTYDVDVVRGHYPALAEGFAHFDGAGGTLVARGVADAIAGVLTAAVANRSAAFEPGRRSIAIVAEAREAVARLVGGAPAGVVFGASSTALSYTVARALAKTWRPGDEIVLSQLDHDANVRPWVQAAATVGADVRWARVDLASGTLPIEQYADLVTDRTRLVAVTAASNVSGSRPDIAKISGYAHTVGALCYVDGVHATPHIPVDVTTLGADFYVTSVYKWSGPHIAACVAAPDRWETLTPDKLLPSSNAVPERFEVGTPSFELLAGVTAAVEQMRIDGGANDLRASMAAIETYESGLFARLLAGLAEVPGIWICPADGDRCPSVSFRLAGQVPADTAASLGRERICVSAGDFYAAEYFEALGLRDRGGAVRAGIYHYTTEAEVDRLLDALHRLAA